MCVSDESEFENESNQEVERVKIGLKKTLKRKKIDPPTIIVFYFFHFSFRENSASARYRALALCYLCSDRD